MKTNKILLSAIAVSIAFASVTSCSSDDGGKKLPPIGGYDSADDVAKADLMAYFPLDGNAKEDISSTSPAASPNTTYVEGIKGEAANFNEGYISYPVISSLTTMQGSFSVSLWAKVANNKTNATMFFQMTRPIDASTNQWNGGINVMAETGKGNREITSDTLQVKGVFNFAKNATDTFGGDAVNAEQLSEQDIANGGQVVVNRTANQWMHVVYVYDGTTAINKLYVNGAKISNPQWEERNKVDGVNVGVPFKLDAASHAIIGAFGTNVKGTPDGWQKAMKGGVDEVRMFKKVLTQAEIGALYELEKAGR